MKGIKHNAKKNIEQQIIAQRLWIRNCKKKLHNESEIYELLGV